MEVTEAVASEPIVDTETLLERLRAGAGEDVGDARPVQIRPEDGYSNRVLQVRFDDGRVLILKEARHDWAARRFEAARAAALLLRHEARVLAPLHLELDGVAAGPVLAYWRIPAPTLKELWPRLGRSRRCQVVRSWGRLLRRVHSVTLTGNGSLHHAMDRPTALEEYLHQDLTNRLLPAVVAVWPAGTGIVESLLGLVDHLALPASGAPPTLLHGDMHMGNVLCEVSGEHVRCVGLIDLESVWAGPAEADIASAHVMHSSLFAQKRRHPRFRARLEEGYGREPDSGATRFFRAYHLANVGFFSALTGRESHAAKVARAAARELEPVTA